MRQNRFRELGLVTTIPRTFLHLANRDMTILAPIRSVGVEIISISSEEAESGDEARRGWERPVGLVETIPSPI